MGCECVVDAKKNDETNDLSIILGNRLKKRTLADKEKLNPLLASYSEDNFTDFLSFSRQLLHQLNQTRSNPKPYIEFLNSNFSQLIIPHEPPLALIDLFQNKYTYEMNSFVELFNNINTLNCSGLTPITWEQRLYEVSSKYLKLIVEFGFTEAHQQMNLNKEVCSALGGNFVTHETIIPGLFELNMSVTLVLLDKVFFNTIMKKNFHGGCVCCISRNNTFFFIVVVVEKIEHQNEAKLSDPLFDYIGFKSEIDKAFILKREDQRVFVRFVLKDGTVIEEYINY